MVYDKGAMQNMKNKKNYMLLFILLVFVTMGCADSDTDDVFVQLDETQENTVVEEEIQTFSEEITTDIEIENTIYVYICGAVVKPGVYDVLEGSRLFEVIQRADGFCNNADKTFLNLARQVNDGEQIIVYTVEETEELKKNGQIQIPENTFSEKVSPIDNGLIDINTATVSELTTITGIGESRAQAIINYRQQHGRLNSIEDIKNVNGIKDGLFSKIKDKITVTGKAG